jgi:hypothetical protein
MRSPTPLLMNVMFLSWDVYCTFLFFKGTTAADFFLRKCMLVCTMRKIWVEGKVGRDVTGQIKRLDVMSYLTKLLLRTRAG